MNYEWKNTKVEKVVAAEVTVKIDENLEKVVSKEIEVDEPDNAREIINLYQKDSEELIGEDEV